MLGFAIELNEVGTEVGADGCKDLREAVKVPLLEYMVAVLGHEHQVNVEQEHIISTSTDIVA
jgi:hypothetical protein